MTMENHVSSEIGTIRKILIHSPDEGIGKIIPSKFKDWLYDDTVHLNKMQKEYDEYIELLLHFMDPVKAKEVVEYIQEHDDRAVYKPGDDAYFNSDKVIDVQKALSDILTNEMIRVRVVAAICAIENCSQITQNQLEKLSPVSLAKTLITGVMDVNGKEKYIFPPVPNLIFTRDIGIVVNKYILLSKTAKLARKRESLIVKYISEHHPNLFQGNQDKIIEITEDSDFFLEDNDAQKLHEITIEGGDIMMIADYHLIIGCSERTSASAVDAIIHKLYSIQDLGIEKISVVKIPAVRAQMHIDTIFTQLGRGDWVLYGTYSEKLSEAKEHGKFDHAELITGREHVTVESQTSVIQFYKQKFQPYEPGRNYFLKKLEGIEELLTTVSIEDYGVPKDEVKIIYSGNDQFPYGEREQWTDSCNLLALKDGVVIGYDRNEKTVEAFKDQVDGLGYDVIQAKDLLEQLRDGKNLHEMRKTLILLSSSELSRARGGSHCMSMPLNRDVMKR
jgi:arginine deiminase